MKVRNLLYQPIELDFGKDVYRFNAGETIDIPSKYKGHATFKLNAKAVTVLDNDPIVTEEVMPKSKNKKQIIEEEI